MCNPEPDAVLARLVTVIASGSELDRRDTHLDFLHHPAGCAGNSMKRLNLLQVNAERGAFDSRCPISHSTLHHSPLREILPGTRGRGHLGGGDEGTRSNSRRAAGKVEIKEHKGEKQQRFMSY